MKYNLIETSTGAQIAVLAKDTDKCRLEFKKIFEFLRIYWGVDTMENGEPYKDWFEAPENRDWDTEYWWVNTKDIKGIKNLLAVLGFTEEVEASYFSDHLTPNWSDSPHERGRLMSNSSGT